MNTPDGSGDSAVERDAQSDVATVSVLAPETPLAGASFLGMPALVLAVQAVGLFVTLLATGGLRLGATEADSKLYLALGHVSFTDVLESTRTFGYPLFLRVVNAGLPLSAVPYIQFVIHVCGVVAFFAALRGIGLSGWTSLAIVSGLLWSNTGIDGFRWLMTDAPGSSLAIMTMAALLVLLRHPRSRAAWLALTVLLIATYQVRPAYQALIVLVPVLGVLLAAQVPASGGRMRPASLAPALAAVCIGPFLAFCLLRWAVVGDFAVVSFTGSNLIGITGQLMTPDVLPHVPAELRQLASEGIIETAKQSGYQGPSTLERLRHDREALNDAFNDTVSRYYALGRRLYDDPARLSNGLTVWRNHPIIDRRLTQLSLHIIRAHPLRYLLHIGRELRVAIARCVTGQRFTWFLGVAFLIGLAVRLVAPARARLRRTTFARAELTRAFTLMAAIACTFGAAHVVLVVLVEPALYRYVDAAAVFLPSMFAVALLAYFAAPDAYDADR